MTQAVQGMPKAALVYSVTEDSGLVFQPWGLISAPECNLVCFVPSKLFVLFVENTVKINQKQ